ncbi:hypothetical protein HK104_004128 [Borealophlyctis nickersoniae]|nr:hypothetical protein HK104_004128 [Borealophlyctis nickersoniae]
MGKKGFMEWLTREFPEACVDLTKRHRGQFDTVYIDINSLLHKCLNKHADTEEKFVKQLFQFLDKILAQTVPMRVAYFAMDGTSPMAKMLEQQKRRKRKQGTSRGMSLHITVGSPFMDRVETHLSYYAVHYMKNIAGPYQRTLKFFIDGCFVPGEGETKIIQNLVAHQRNDHASAAIVSIDGDVIVQAMAAGMPNVYVVRKIKTERHRCISIDAFIKALDSRLGNGHRARLDFVLLTLLGGNDYLKKLRGASMDALWVKYCMLKDVEKDGWLVDPEGKRIDLEMLRKLCEVRLGRNWRQYRKKPPPIPSPMPPAAAPPPKQTPASDVIDTEEEDTEEIIVFSPAATLPSRSAVAESSEDLDLPFAKDDLDVFPDDDEEAEKEDADEDDDDDEDDEEDEEDFSNLIPHSNISSPSEYIQGLLWNLDMYITGVCGDYGYIYEYPYAPVMPHLAKWIEERGGRWAGGAGGPGSGFGGAAAPQEPLMPLMCAFMVIPQARHAEILPAFPSTLPIPIAPETPTVASIAQYVDTLLPHLQTVPELRKYLAFRKPVVWGRATVPAPQTDGYRGGYHGGSRGRGGHMGSGRVILPKPPPGRWEELGGDGWWRKEVTVLENAGIAMRWERDWVIRGPFRWPYVFMRGGSGGGRGGRGDRGRRNAGPARDCNVNAHGRGGDVGANLDGVRIDARRMQARTSTDAPSVHAPSVRGAHSHSHVGQGG